MFRILITVTLALAFHLSAIAQSSEQLLEEATTYYDNEQHREALNLLDKYVLLDSTNAEAYKMRGNCYNVLNQVEKAEANYRKAIQVDPEITAAYYNLANILENREVGSAIGRR